MKNRFHYVMTTISIIMFIIFPLVPGHSQSISYGDVNDDGAITIVDALLTAQYFVELDPGGFIPERADVNGNGRVEIVDALLIAQHYVGIIDQFPVEIATPTDPPGPGGLTLVGSLDTTMGHRGTWTRMAVTGDYLYVLAGLEEIKIFDIQNPLDPQFIKDTGIKLEGYPMDTAITPSHLFYLDSETESLCTINITNIVDPVPGPSLLLPSRPNRIEIMAGYAYITCNDHFIVVDITTPDAMTIEYETDLRSYCVEIMNNSLYLSTWEDDSEFRIYSLSNPSYPVLIGSAPANIARSMAVNQGYAYCATFDVLSIFDTSHPDTISLVSEFNVTSYIDGDQDIVDITYINGILALSHHRGTTFINVTDPGNLFIIHTEPSPALVYSVDKTGTTLYAVASTFANGSQLSAFDISNPDSPVVSKIIDGYGSALDVVVSGNYAYLAEGYGGIKIVDISDPAAPFLVSGADTENYATDLDISGNTLCVSNTGISVFDVTDPSQPELKATLATFDQAREVKTAGNYAFVADAPWALTVIDISNINRPFIAFEMKPEITPTPEPAQTSYPVITAEPNLTAQPSAPPPTPVPHPDEWWSKSIAVENDVAYLAVAREPFVRIVDISSPYRPVEIAQYNDLSGAEDIAVSGDFAYVATSSYENDLQILNISNPYSPFLTGLFHNSEGEIREVIVSGTSAYLLVDRDIDCILRVDVSDPYSPVLEQEIELNHRDTRNIYIRGNYLYVANGCDSSMLLIYRIEQ